MRVKIYYKLSKCYREMGDNEGRVKYEGLALREAARIGNLKL